eukprot:TRINITY_DN44461_c0_g1_i1.p1 TRINITY_DN44461_c0_g1~~TRINITY_DN44461_c0_g1_i1.p1  ORF type:complete len:118 (-),score=34.34 TRINITY_DN44461_c0_g1_i1:37-390(-)
MCIRDRRMIFISLTLVFPFLVYTMPVLNMRTIHGEYQRMASFQLFSMYLLGTIGSLQIFHGTLSVRGSDKVLRSTNLVLGTTVIEMIMLVFYIQAYIGFDVAFEYVLTIFNLKQFIQ